MTRVTRLLVLLSLLLAGPARAAGGDEAKEPPGSFLGRFTYNLALGAELSQDHGDFSEVDFYLRLDGDTAWRSSGAEIAVAVADRIREEEGGKPEGFDEDCKRATARTCRRHVEAWLDGETGRRMPDAGPDEATKAREALRAEVFTQAMSHLRWWDWRNAHTRAAFSLTTIPVEGLDPTAETFITSKKSLVAELAADWLFVRKEIADGRSLRFGPSLNGGFQTADRDPAFPELDSVSNFWGVGVRMTEGRVESLARPNPPQNRYVAFYYGEYEHLGKHRFTVDARLQPDGGGPFFGFRSIVGSGPDDVRIYAGVSVGLDKVGSFLFEALNLEALGGVRSSVSPTP